jgi:2-succinyl-6-hydroxy-2,4-cyclohexadiene-1-carboxylate synthase
VRDLTGPLAARSTGAGDRVVLVHGFTQTGRSWDRILADLRRDHEVVTVDAPGHGGSGAVRADLPATATLLAETTGRATYVGYSMGGRFCLHLALAHPELVTRLVLLGATAGIDDPDERAARRAADDALAAELEREGVDAFLVRWLANPMFAGLPDDPAERAERRRNTAAGLAASLRLAGTGTQEPLWDRLGTLTMPVLVLAGERDAKFTELGHRLAGGIGAHARFATVAGAGHAAHLEQPEAFLRLVREWLAQTSRVGEPGSR